jgi:hypothetical protein
VKDHDRDGQTGEILEFTLARLYSGPENHSVGAYQTETRGGPTQVAIPDPTAGPLLPSLSAYWPNNWWWPGLDNWDYYKPGDTPGIARVVVPVPLRPDLAARRAPPAPPTLQFEVGVALDPVACQALSSGTLILAGTATSWPVGGKALNTSSAPGREVGLWRLWEDPCVNRPDRWELLATVKTDSQGRFRLPVKPPYLESRQVFAAAIAEKSGRILASSHPLVYREFFGARMLFPVQATQPWQKVTELLGAPDAAVD